MPLDTRALIARVKRIEIRVRRRVDELTGGAYHSVFKGRGIEFDEVREYQPGDDVRAIDWNVTARQGHPYLKKFVEERELTVLLAVDISASQDFGSAGQRKQELAAELAALLAFSAIRNHDRAGLLLFSDQDELYLAPRRGRTHGLRLVRELVACERRHRGTNLRHALEGLARSLRRRAVVFLISDFLDEGYERALALLARRHDLVAIRVLDERELALPAAGHVAVEDAETGAVRVLPTGRRKFRQAFGAASRTQHDALTRALRRGGVDFIDLRTGADYLPALMAFFRARERRRRGAARRK